MLFCASRKVHNNKDTWDVWVLVPFSWACVVALSLVCLCESLIEFVQPTAYRTQVTVKVGCSGRHIVYYMLYHPAQIETYLKFQTTIEFLYCVAATVPKIAILSLYLRIFPDRLVRGLTWAVIIAIVLQWFSMGVVV